MLLARLLSGEREGKSGALIRYVGSMWGICSHGAWTTWIDLLILAWVPQTQERSRDAQGR